MKYSKSIFSVQGILQIVIFMSIFSRKLADNKYLKNYGPYTVDYKEFTACAGPKSKNLSDYHIEMTKINGDYMANFSFTFYNQCRFDNVKVKAFLVEKGQKKALLNYNVDNPCQHFAFSSVLQKYFGANGCVVNKGTYNFNLNLSNITRMFYGESFFYGEFETKSVLTSKKGNIGCGIARVIFNKPK